MDEQSEKSWSNSKKLVKLFNNNVVQEVLIHYNKPKTIHIEEKEMAEKVEPMHIE